MPSRRFMGWPLVATASVVAVLATPQAQANHIETAGGGFGHDNTIPDGFGTGNVCNVNDGCFIAENKSNGNGSTGLIGRHTVDGGTAAPFGAGVFGESYSQSINAVGVYGRVAPNGQPASGSAGVRGDNGGVGSAYTDTAGVYGYNSAKGYGVRGYSEAGNGVYGYTNSTLSSIAGVYGDSVGANTYGVRGNGEALTGSVGVYGSGARGVVGVHYGSVGSDPGVEGDTDGSAGNAVGVLGKVTSTSSGAKSTAVLGLNNSTSKAGFGLWGSQAGAGYGVYGTTPSGIGVDGESPSGYGVVGKSTTGWAGYFLGDVTVSGTLFKGAGAFKIDDPIAPARKYLQHSFVESPDMMDIYNGNVTTDRQGFATVTMPRWFQALNRTFRYQLTIVGTRGWNARVVKPIAHERFTIQTDRPRVRVSWQVTGIRHDPYANAHRIQVVVPKTGAQRGKYMHPGLYRQPASKAVFAPQGG